MSCFDNDLSNAVEIFLGFGSALYPSQHHDSLTRKFGPEKTPGLIAQVKELIREMNGIDIDWAVHSLQSAGDRVEEEMHTPHPELSGRACQALAWSFSFDWR